MMTFELDSPVMWTCLRLSLFSASPSFFSGLSFYLFSSNPSGLVKTELEICHIAKLCLLFTGKKKRKSE